MKYFKFILILLILGLTAKVTTNIWVEDIDEDGSYSAKLDVNKEQQPEARPLKELQTVSLEVITPPYTESTKFLFPEDWAEESELSSPSNIVLPKGLSSLFDIRYEGAFRVTTKNGDSDSNYAVGVIAYNPSKDSIFLAGHDHHDAIAEFKIPETLSFESSAKQIPNAEVLQPYVRLLDDTKNNKITGMLVYNEHLLVNSEIWYDARGNNADNMQVLDIKDITKAPKGMLQLEGKAKAAGYMSKIPESMRVRLGGDYLSGWASNYSITGRYSQGPSLYIFDPEDATKTLLKVPSKAVQTYPMEWGKMLVDGAHYTRSKDISPIWGPMAKARYGFIVPATSIFLVIGSHAGIHSGIFYKQDKTENTRTCGGSCPYDPTDSYNYFWLYDVDEMLATENTWSVKPFSYGKWNMPFKGQIIGATTDGNGRLFLSISGAGKTGKYDKPPLILTYNIKKKVP